MLPLAQRLAKRYSSISPVIGEEDLAQEAVIVLMRCADRFPDIPEEEFGFLVRRSVRNMVVSLSRRAARTSQTVDVDIDLSGYSPDVSFDVEAGIEELAKMLSPRGRRVLRHILRTGLKGREAVESSGMTSWDYYSGRREIKRAAVELCSRM